MTDDITHKSDVRTVESNGYDGPINAAMLTPSDAQYGSQWHLNSGSGWDINVTDVWDHYTGAGVRVAVYDQGIDATHIDLNDNYDFARDISTTGVGDGTPHGFGDNHGTAVAGIIAAELGDGDVVGIAYDASLVSVYDPLTFAGFEGRIATAFNHAETNADVINNSWGYGNQFIFFGAESAFSDDFNNAAFTNAANELRDMANNGRGGLGTIVVQAAGNAKQYGDDTNLHNFQNSRYTVTVAATLEDGDATCYSTPGASILIAAPGSDSTTCGDGPGSILTTDRVGGNGYNNTDYMPTFNGTSAATPMISGVVALMLEANADLGWRDVQEILAYSARNSDADESSTTWDFNGATNWNGGGLHFSHDLGFGLVDAHAAVKLAETWQTQHTSSNHITGTTTRNPNLAIPDNNGIGVSDTVNWGFTDRVIDRVEVDLDISHTFIGDLVVELTSPNGTTSRILNRPGRGPSHSDPTDQNFGSSQNNVDFTFTSTHFLGESADGNWTLRVRDLAGGDVGTLNSWTLRFIYDADNGDDTYIYTNEFSDVTTVARRTLNDADGGTDTINAAAVTSNSYINLDAGSTDTRIDGVYVTMASGTIENAFGGVGHDTLLGNSANNTLMGDDGNDYINGNYGLDYMDGGDGIDTVSYSWFHNAATYNLATGVASGLLWSETIRNFENIYTGNAADTVIGTFGANTIVTNGGNDSVTGGDGNDYISTGANEDSVDAGTGNDIVYGGTGNDSLLGNLGNDSLYGGDGDDTIDGGYSEDYMDGGDGTDTVSLAFWNFDTVADLIAGTANNGATGGTWSETILNFENIDTGNGNDTIDATHGVNRIVTNGGNDTVNAKSSDDYVSTGAGDDSVNAGRGKDQVFGGDGDDLLRGQGGKDTIYGGNGKDVINGGEKNDTIYGGADDDVLRGAEGEDLLFGGLGNDKLDGGIRSDVLWGESGDDSLTGGDMADDFRFAGVFGSDVIADFSRTEGDDIWLDSASLGVFNFNDLLPILTTTASGHSLIDFGANGDILVKDMATMVAGDFVFF